MYLYAVAEGLEGPCKIGFGADPRRRLCELQIGNPRKLSLVCHVQTDNYRLAERLAHHRAGLKRQLSGEWFDVAAYIAKEAVLFGCEEADRMTQKRRARLDPALAPMIQQIKRLVT